MAIRLWLDDERDPRDPAIQARFGARGDELWVTTVAAPPAELKVQRANPVRRDEVLVAFANARRYWQAR